MANQSIVFDVGVDTSNAESGLKKLEQDVPKSIRKTVENIEKLSARIRKAGQGIADRADREIARRTAYAKELKGIAEDYRKTIQTINRENKALNSTRAFQGLSSGLKKATREYSQFTKTQLKLKADMAEAMGKLDKNFDTRKIEAAAAKLNAIGARLQKTTGGKFQFNPLDPKQVVTQLTNNINKIDQEFKKKSPQMKRVIQGSIEKIFADITPKRQTSLSMIFKREVQELTNQLAGAPTKRLMRKAQAVREQLSLFGLSDSSPSTANNFLSKFRSATRKMNQQQAAIMRQEIEKYRKNMRGVYGDDFFDMAGVKDASQIRRRRDFLAGVSQLMKEEEDFIKKLNAREKRTVQRSHGSLGQFPVTPSDLRHREQMLATLRRQNDEYRKLNKEISMFGEPLTKRKSWQLGVFSGLADRDARFNVRAVKKAIDYDGQWRELQKLRDEYKALTNNYMDLTHLSQKQLATTEKALDALGEKKRNIEQKLSRITRLRQEGMDDIANTGRFSRKGIQKGTPVWKELKKEEEKKLDAIKVEVEKMYRKKLGDTPYFDDNKMKAFVNKMIQDISGGKQMIRDSGGWQSYIRQRVKMEADREGQAINRAIEAERGYRKKHYRQAADEMRAFADKIGDMENDRARKTAQNARKLATSMEMGNARVLRNYHDNQQKLVVAYRKAIQQEIDHWKQRRDAVRQGAGLLDFQARKAAREANKRINQLQREADRAKQYTAQDIVGDQTAKRAGGGGSGMKFPNAQADAYAKNMDKIAQAYQKVQRTGHTLNRMFVVLGAGLGVHQLGQYFDEWVQFNNRLKLVTTSMSEFNTVQRELVKVSNQTGTSLFASGGLFEKFSRAGDIYGVSNEMKAAMTRLVQQTVAISGTTAEGAKGAIVQFVQGLGTELRGQELASVREQIPRLARAIADGLNVPISMLKELGAQGKITGDQIMKALVSQLPIIESEFKNVTFTISMSFQKISNAVQELMGRTVDQLQGDGAVQGMFDSIAKFIEDLTKSGSLAKLTKTLLEMKDVAVTLAGLLAVGFAGSMVGGMAAGIGGRVAGSVGHRARSASVHSQSLQNRGMGRGASALGGFIGFMDGGFLDSKGNVYTVDDKEKIIKENERIREKNREILDKNLKTGSKDSIINEYEVPQRRNKLLGKEAFFDAGKKGALLSVGAIATAAYMRDEKVKETLDKALNSFVDFLAGVGRAIYDFMDEWGMLSKTDPAKKAKEELYRAQADTMFVGRVQGQQIGAGMTGGALDQAFYQQLIQADQARLKEVNAMSQSDFAALGGAALAAQLQANIDFYKQISSGGLTITADPKSQQINQQVQELSLGITQNTAKGNQVLMQRDSKQRSTVQSLRSEIDDLAGSDYNQLSAILDQAATHVETYFDLSNDYIQNQRDLSQTQRELAKNESAENTEMYEAAVAEAQSRLDKTKNQINDVVSLIEGVRSMTEVSALDETVLTPHSRVALIQLIEGFDQLRAGVAGTAAEMVMLDQKTSELSDRREEIVKNNKSQFGDDVEGIDVTNKRFIANLRKSNEKEISNVKNAINKASSEFIGTFTNRYTEEEKNLSNRLAEINKGDLESKENLKAKYLFTVDADMNPIVKDEKTLETNRGYQVELMRLEKERELAIARAEKSKEEAIARLAVEVELNQDLLALQEESYKLTLLNKEAYSVDIEGSSTLRNMEQQSRGFQKKFIQNVTSYLMQTGMEQDFTKLQLMMDEMASGNLENAIKVVEEFRTQFEYGTEEYSRLTSMMDKLSGELIVARSNNIAQSRSSLIEMRRAASASKDEFRVLKELAAESAGAISLITAGSTYGNDPMGSIAASIISSRESLAVQKSAIEKEIGKINADLFDLATGFDPLTDDEKARQEVLRNALASKELERDGKLLEGKQIMFNSLMELERAREAAEIQNQVNREIRAKQEERIDSIRKKSGMELLKLDIERTRIQDKRSRGAALSGEELSFMANAEAQRVAAEAELRRTTATEQIALNLEKALRSSELNEQALLETTEVEEERNKIIAEAEALRTASKEAAELELTYVEKMLEAEEALAKVRRDSNAQRNLMNTRLFSTTESEKMSTEQKELYAMVFGQPRFAEGAQRRRKVEQLQNQPQSRNQDKINSLSQMYGLPAQDAAELELLKRDAVITEDYFRWLSDYSKNISKYRQDAIDNANQLTDQESYYRALAENATMGSDAFFEALSASRSLQISDFINSFSNELEDTRLQNGWKRTSDAYINYVREETIKFGGRLREEVAKISRSTLGEARGILSAFTDENFNPFNMDQEDIQTIAKYFDGLQSVLDLESSQRNRSRGANPLDRIQSVDRDLNQTIVDMQKAINEGNLKEASSLEKKANAMMKARVELQEMADVMGIYNQEQNENLQISLKLERTQQFNTMGNSQRELQSQLELARMRKEGIKNEAELAKVAAAQKKEALDQELLQERQLLLVRLEQQRISIENQYNANDFRGDQELQQAEIRFNQETRLLEIQTQQKKIAVDTALQIERLNKEQAKTIKTSQQAITDVLSAYYGFIGSAFKSIFEAIFGSPTRKKDPLSEADRRIQALEKQKQELEKEINLQISTNTLNVNMTDLTSGLDRLRQSVDILSGIMRGAGSGTGSFTSSSGIAYPSAPNPNLNSFNSPSGRVLSPVEKKALSTSVLGYGGSNPSENFGSPIKNPESDLNIEFMQELLAQNQETKEVLKNLMPKASKDQIEMYATGFKHFADSAGLDIPMTVENFREVFTKQIIPQFAEAASVQSQLDRDDETQSKIYNRLDELLSSYNNSSIMNSVGTQFRWNELSEVLNKLREVVIIAKKQMAVEKYADGGMLSGPSHSTGGIPLGNNIEAEGGEYIIKKSSVQKLGVENLDFINQMGVLPQKYAKGGIIPTVHYGPAGLLGNFSKGTQSVIDMANKGQDVPREVLEKVYEDAARRGATQEMEALQQVMTADGKIVGQFYHGSGNSGITSFKDKYVLPHSEYILDVGIHAGDRRLAEKYAKSASDAKARHYLASGQTGGDPTLYENLVFGKNVLKIRRGQPLPADIKEELMQLSGLDSWYMALHPARMFADKNPMALIEAAAGKDNHKLREIFASRGIDVIDHYLPVGRVGLPKDAERAVVALNASSVSVRGSQPVMGLVATAGGSYMMLSGSEAEASPFSKVGKSKLAQEADAAGLNNLTWSDETIKMTFANDPDDVEPMFKPKMGDYVPKQEDYSAEYLRKLDNRYEFAAGNDRAKAMEMLKERRDEAGYGVTDMLHVTGEKFNFFDPDAGGRGMIFSTNSLSGAKLASQGGDDYIMPLALRADNILGSPTPHGKFDWAYAEDYLDLGPEWNAKLIDPNWQMTYSMLIDELRNVARKGHDVNWERGKYPDYTELYDDAQGGDFDFFAQDNFPKGTVTGKDVENLYHKMFEAIKAQSIKYKDAEPRTILQAMDADAVWIRDEAGTSLGVRYSNQAKRMEITYDEDGNLIPLSKRFDITKGDNRYGFVAPWIVGGGAAGAMMTGGGSEAEASPYYKALSMADMDAIAKRGINNEWRDLTKKYQNTDFVVTPDMDRQYADLVANKKFDEAELMLKQVAQEVGGSADGIKYFHVHERLGRREHAQLEWQEFNNRIPEYAHRGRYNMGFVNVSKQASLDGAWLLDNSDQVRTLAGYLRYDNPFGGSWKHDDFAYGITGEAGSYELLEDWIPSRLTDKWFLNTPPYIQAILSDGLRQLRINNDSSMFRLLTPDAEDALNDYIAEIAAGNVWPSQMIAPTREDFVKFFEESRTLIKNNPEYSDMGRSAFDMRTKHNIFDYTDHDLAHVYDEGDISQAFRYPEQFKSTEVTYKQGIQSEVNRYGQEEYDMFGNPLELIKLSNRFDPSKKSFLYSFAPIVGGTVGALMASEEEAMASDSYFKILSNADYLKYGEEIRNRDYRDLTKTYKNTDYTVTSDMDAHYQNLVAQGKIKEAEEFLGNIAMKVGGSADGEKYWHIHRRTPRLGGTDRNKDWTEFNTRINEERRFNMGFVNKDLNRAHDGALEWVGDDKIRTLSGYIRYDNPFGGSWVDEFTNVHGDPDLRGDALQWSVFEDWVPNSMSQEAWMNMPLAHQKRMGSALDHLRTDPSEDIDFIFSPYERQTIDDFVDEWDMGLHPAIPIRPPTSRQMVQALESAREMIKQNRDLYKPQMNRTKRTMFDSHDYDFAHIYDEGLISQAFRYPEQFKSTEVTYKQGLHSEFPAESIQRGEHLGEKLELIPASQRFDPSKKSFLYSFAPLIGGAAGAWLGAGGNSFREAMASELTFAPNGLEDISPVSDMATQLENYTGQDHEFLRYVGTTLGEILGSPVDIWNLVMGYRNLPAVIGHVLAASAKGNLQMMTGRMGGTRDYMDTVGIPDLIKNPTTYVYTGSGEHLAQEIREILFNWGLINDVDPTQIEQVASLISQFGTAPLNLPAKLGKAGKIASTVMFHEGGLLGSQDHLMALQNHFGPQRVTNLYKRAGSGLMDFISNYPDMLRSDLEGDSTNSMKEFLSTPMTGDDISKATQFLAANGFSLYYDSDPNKLAALTGTTAAEWENEIDGLQSHKDRYIAVQDNGTALSKQTLFHEMAHAMDSIAFEKGLVKEAPAFKFFDQFLSAKGDLYSNLTAQAESAFIEQFPSADPNDPYQPEVPFLIRQYGKKDHQKVKKLDFMYKLMNKTRYAEFGSGTQAYLAQQQPFQVPANGTDGSTRNMFYNEGEFAAILYAGFRQDPEGFLKKYPELHNVMMNSYGAIFKGGGCIPKKRKRYDDGGFFSRGRGGWGNPSSNNFWSSVWETLTTGIGSGKKQSVNDPRSGSLWQNLKEYWSDQMPEEGFWSRFMKKGSQIWDWVKSLFGAGDTQKHSRGGYLTGPSHEQGGIDLGVIDGVRHEAEGGEYIIKRSSVDRIGQRTLDFINSTGTLPPTMKFGNGTNEVEELVTFWDKFWERGEQIWKKLTSLFEDNSPEGRPTSAAERMSAALTGQTVMQVQQSQPPVPEPEISQPSQATKLYSQRENIAGEIEAKMKQLRGTKDVGESAALNQEIAQLRISFSKLGENLDEMNEATGASQDIKNFIGTIDDAAIRQRLLALQEEKKFYTLQQLIDNAKKYMKDIEPEITTAEGKKEKGFFGQLFSFMEDEKEDSPAKKEEEKIPQKDFFENMTDGFQNFFKEEREDGTMSEASLGTGAKKLAAGVAAVGAGFGRGGKMMTDMAMSGGDPTKMAAAMGEFIMGNEKIQKVFQKFGDIITQILDPLAEVFVPVLEQLGELFVTLAQVIGPLIKAINGVVGGVVGGVLGAVNSVVNTVVDFGHSIFGGSRKKSQDYIDEQTLNAIKDSMNSRDKELDKWNQTEADKILDNYRDVLKQAGDIHDASLREEAKMRIYETLNKERLIAATQDLYQSMEKASAALISAAEAIGVNSILFLDALTKERLNEIDPSGDTAKSLLSQSEGRSTYTGRELASSGWMRMLLTNSVSGFEHRPEDNMTVTEKDVLLALNLNDRIESGLVRSGNSEKPFGQFVNYGHHNYQLPRDGWNLWQPRWATDYSASVKDFDNPNVRGQLGLIAAQSLSDDIDVGLSSGKKGGKVVDAFINYDGAQDIADRISGLELRDDMFVYDGPTLSDASIILFESFVSGVSDITSDNYDMSGAQKAIEDFVIKVLENLEQSALHMLDAAEFNFGESFGQFIVDASGSSGYQGQINKIASEHASVLLGSDGLLDKIFKAMTDTGAEQEDRHLEITTRVNQLTAEESAALGEILSVMVQQLKAFNDAMEDMTSNMGRYTFSQKQFIEKSRYAEEIAGKGFRNEDAVILFKLFEEKQAIDLQVAMIDLTNQILDLNNSISAKNFNFAGLEATYGGSSYAGFSVRDTYGTPDSRGTFVRGAVSEIQKSLLSMGIRTDGSTATEEETNSTLDPSTKAVVASNSASQDATESLRSVNLELIKAILNNTMALEDSSEERHEIDYTDPTQREKDAEDEQEDKVSTADLANLVHLPDFLKDNASIDFSSVTGANDLVTKLNSSLDFNAINASILDSGMGQDAIDRIFGTDGIQLEELMNPEVFEKMPQAVQELISGITAITLRFDELDASLTNFDLVLGKETFGIITDGMTATLKATYEGVEKVNEIINSESSQEIKNAAIAAQGVQITAQRLEVIDEIDSRGYNDSSYQSMVRGYEKEIKSVTDSIAYLESKDSLSPEESAELAHLNTQYDKLNAARTREANLITKDLMKSLESVGVQYSDLGNANNSFKDNIQTISSMFATDFKLPELDLEAFASGASDVNDIIGDMSHLTEDEQEMVRKLTKEAIAGRERELALIEKQNKEADINRMSSFFGTEEDYTFVQFREAMSALEEVIESLDDTIKDLYYSDYNRDPLAEKLISAEQEYASLLSKAMAPDPETGSYNLEAIEEFKGFVNQYLDYNKEMYKSSSEYQDVYDQVMGDLERVKGVAGVYGTKTETDKLIEALGELKDAIQVEDGTADSIEGLISKLKQSLPEGLDDAYDHITEGAIDFADEIETMMTGVDADISKLNDVVLPNFNTFMDGIETGFSDLLGENGTVRGFISTFTTDWNSKFTSAGKGTLLDSFQTFVTKVQAMVDGLEVEQITGTGDDSTTGGNIDHGQNLGGSSPDGGSFGSLEGMSTAANLSRTYTTNRDGFTYEGAGSYDSASISASNFSSAADFMGSLNESVMKTGGEAYQHYAEKDGTYYAFRSSDSMGANAVKSLVESSGAINSNVPSEYSTDDFHLRYGNVSGLTHTTNAGELYKIDNAIVTTDKSGEETAESIHQKHGKEITVQMANGEYRSFDIDESKYGNIVDDFVKKAKGEISTNYLSVSIDESLMNGGPYGYYGEKIFEVITGVNESKGLVGKGLAKMEDAIYPSTSNSVWNSTSLEDLERAYVYGGGETSDYPLAWKQTAKEYTGDYPNGKLATFGSLAYYESQEDLDAAIERIKDAGGWHIRYKDQPNAGLNDFDNPFGGQRFNFSSMGYDSFWTPKGFAALSLKEQYEYFKDSGLTSSLDNGASSVISSLHDPKLLFDVFQFLKNVETGKAVQDMYIKNKTGVGSRKINFGDGKPDVYYESGGYLNGPSHSMGGIPIEAEGGEFIIRKSSVNKIGLPFLEYLNEEGELPFFKFGMGEMYKSDPDMQSNIDSDDSELKSMVRELITAIREGDGRIENAISDLDLSPEINVYTDLDGEMDSRINSIAQMNKEKNKRGLHR